jgi:SAM-dependent methyltransferase
MYDDIASYYDAIYHWKDYPAEADRLHLLLAEHGIPIGARVLEAACGTGTHLSLLKRWYCVAGFDLSEPMLRIARRKLEPEIPLFRADLTSFAVAQPFDAALCLFSSIGYVHPEERLRASAACFARAVRPGGFLIVEPWLTEAIYTAGKLTMQTYDGDDLKLCRSVISRKEAALSVHDFHWLVARKGAPDVEHLVDEHRLWLCPTETLLAAFQDAGFDARFEPDGLMKDRGLIIARRR